MKKNYITPTTSIVKLASENLCQIITGSDGHKKPDGSYESDEHIPSGGNSDGEDFAKHYDVWSTWDE